MNNKEVLEIMNKRFDSLDSRLDKIDKDIKPLIEYKAKSEGSVSTLKYIVGIGFTVIIITISLIALHLKQP